MNRENAPKPNAECVICGRKYYRCARCIELRNRGIEAWKLHCDSMECFVVHTILENANKGNFNQDMLDELNTIKLSDDREFKEDVYKKIQSLNGINEVKDEAVNVDEGETSIDVASEICMEDKGYNVFKGNRRTKAQERAKGKTKNVK